MLQQFIFANLHFALTLTAALVYFSTGWLYLDSWQFNRKERSPLFRSIGFFMLAAASALQAVQLVDIQLNFLIEAGTIGGLLLILYSLIIEPILAPPSRGKAAAMIPLAVGTYMLVPFSAVLYLLIAITYWRKTTEGYEKQLKPAAEAFFFLAVAKYLSTGFFLAESNSAYLSQLFGEFGTMWIIVHLLEAVAILILGAWVWGYIRFRLNVQMFVITISLALFAFVVTTVLFTFLLLKNLEQDALSHLQTDVKVFHYALERLQSEALADAHAVANDSALQEAVRKNNRSSLASVTEDFLKAQNTSFLHVASTSGQVVMRGEDAENVGDSVADDPLVKSALTAKPLSTVRVFANDILPRVQVQAAAPIVDKASGKLLGVVLTGFEADNAFVDGVKTITDLDTTIFAGDIRAATTFVSPDGASRLTGTREGNKTITNTVLKDGKTYVGSANVLNQPFYTAYTPLRTIGNETVGMMFVGKLQSELFKTAQRSIALTFLGSVILIILSLIPSYYIARYIQKQVEA